MSIEQQPAAIPFNDEIAFILGQPSFYCCRYAYILRRDGKDIPERAEHEQAAVIHWFLNLYLKHGKLWRDEVVKEIDRIEKIGKGSNES